MTRTNLSLETAELSADVCAALTHELGGVAGALDLRASALATVLPPHDVLALTTLADEVRMVTRGLRLVRGMPASDALLPMRLHSVDEWWTLASRFTTFVLPRGVIVEARFEKAQLANTQSAVATWLWLAAAKELVALGVSAPCTIVLQGRPWQEGSDHLTLGATLEAVHTRGSRRSAARSRWVRYATRLAESYAAELSPWRQSGRSLAWSCTVPRTTPAAAVAAAPAGA